MNYKNITFQEIKNNVEIKTYIYEANSVLGAMGFTDHSSAHTMKVAEDASNILKKLDYSERDIELSKIASYMHDVGNMFNRSHHAQNGAVMVFNILREMGMHPAEIALICSAIGHHDESDGRPVNNISAAIIIADKADVRRSRVRKNKDKSNFDIHDRVNYAVEKAILDVEKDTQGNDHINLKITIDISICSVMEYFEIFLTRMLMCTKAAEFLNSKFHLYVNEAKIL